MAGHVRQRGQKWQAIASYRDPRTGKLVQLSETHPTKRAADRALAGLLARASSQDRPVRGTVSELIDAWWKVNVDKWSKHTEEVRRSMFKRHVREQLGHYRLKSLSTYDMEEFFTDLDLGSQTARHLYNILHAVFEAGVRWDWIKTNPLRDVQPPKVKRRRFTPPEPEQIFKLLTACQEEGEWFELFVRLAIASGARRGDLCRLQWQHVDFSAGRVLIAGEKTDNPHEVALGPDMLRRLAEWRQFKWQGPWLFSTDLFHRTHVDPSYVSLKFKQARERVGLDHLHLHDLRHTNATWLLNQGIPVTTVSYRLGHSRTSTTHDIYAQRVPTDDVRAANALDDLLTGD